MMTQFSNLMKYIGLRVPVLVCLFLSLYPKAQAQFSDTVFDSSTSMSVGKRGCSSYAENTEIEAILQDRIKNLRLEFVGSINSDPSKSTCRFSVYDSISKGNLISFFSDAKKIPASFIDPYPQLRETVEKFIKLNDPVFQAAELERKVKIVKKYSPSASRVLDALPDHSSFKFFSRDADLISGLDSGIHESVHELDRLANNTQTLFLTSGERIVLSSNYGNTLSISNVLPFLTDKQKVDAYATEYLMRSMGEQGYHILLTELNAYTHGGRVTLDVRSQIKPEDIQTSWLPKAKLNPGLQHMMLYVETYIGMTKIKSPDVYALITKSDYQEAIKKLWSQAEQVLSDACASQALEVTAEELALIKDVYGSPHKIEIEKLIGRAIQIPQTCIE